MSPKGCACKQKMKFPIRSLQEKMEKQSFNSIDPDNIAYVSTRILPSSKNLGKVAQFIQGHEAQSTIMLNKLHAKNYEVEYPKKLKEHLNTYNVHVTKLETKRHLRERIKEEASSSKATPKSAKQRARVTGQQQSLASFGAVKRQL